MSNTLHTNYLRTHHNCRFNFSFVTREEVAKVIASLKPKSSSRVDGISTFLIRFIKDKIADPLTKTINLYRNFSDKYENSKIYSTFLKT